MSNKKIINYTSRDFDSIKKDLLEHAQRFYPDNFKDFSENSFGSYILDTVAYVGDMLSFYVDYQVNESFLETALEYENVRKLVKNQGYNYTGRPAAYGLATFYIIVPGRTTGLGPEATVIPVLSKGSEFKSNSGQSFVLTEDVDFSDPKNEIVAARFSQVTGKATSWAIRAHGMVKSTVLFQTQVEIGNMEKFLTVRVGPASIAEIKSVIDSDGHEYFEVDNLSQDTIYINSTNPNASIDGVPDIIKPKIVPRRFCMKQDDTGTYLQFGHGSDKKEALINVLDPSQATLKMSGKHYITDNAFDPNELLSNSSLGIAPSNTTLTIRYYDNEQNSVNVSAGDLNSVSVVGMRFPKSIGNTLSEEGVKQSLEVSNDQAIVENTERPSTDHLRQVTYAAKAAQKRVVTRNDYEAYIYMMPSNFGKIKRAVVYNDPSGTNRRLSVYVVSQDGDANLIETNSTIKENLKTWLNKNKMLNDNIDIYGAKIVNIGFTYEIIVDPTSDKVQVLNSVNRKLLDYFSDKMYIGEPFYISRIFNIINKVEGVLDTVRVTPEIKVGTGYSGDAISIQEMKSNDGTYIKAPINSIFEIKYPGTDIRGTAT